MFSPLWPIKWNRHILAHALKIIIMLLKHVSSMFFYKKITHFFIRKTPYKKDIGKISAEKSCRTWDEAFNLLKDFGTKLNVNLLFRIPAKKCLKKFKNFLNFRLL